MCRVNNELLLNEGLKKNIKKLLDLSIRAGWLGSAGDQNPTKKKYKDDQNGLIHPEN